mgnify:FL=1
MSYSLVTESEFCWVLEWLEPATTRELAEVLPTSNKGVYMRLKRFDGTYVSHTGDLTNTYEWSLTDEGKAVAGDADLPPIETVDLDEYFAGRSTSINPNAILYEIAIYDDEWVPTSPLYDALPYAKSTLRRRLRRFSDKGELERDASAKTNRWRLTDAGCNRLADAEEVKPLDESSRIFEPSKT